MSREIRKAGNYNIINSIHIGDKELLLGENMEEKDGYFYMTCFSERDDLFERFSEVLTGNNFLEIAEIYSDRLKEQIEKTKASEKDMPKGIITGEMCDSITDKNLEGEIIVIDPKVLRPEYQTEAHQIVRCTGGNGARPATRGSAVFCDYLYKDNSTRFERYDVLGILKKEYYPEWLNQKLEIEKTIKENPNAFEYGGCHFLPVGVINGSTQFEHITHHTAPDRKLGIWTNQYVEKYGENKIDYKHKDFYMACNDIPCDIFKCLENGKVYIPAENELLEYTGEYKPYTDNGYSAILGLGKAHEYSENYSEDCFDEFEM